MKQIIECVPNFSEGNDLTIIKQITDEIESIEAVKLLDYDHLNQKEVAEIMEISRPTLTRIYERARKKIATAIAEGKNIKFGGGNIMFEKNWYECASCQVSFNAIGKNKDCPFCLSHENVDSFNELYNG